MKEQNKPSILLLSSPINSNSLSNIVVEERAIRKALILYNITRET